MTSKRAQRTAPSKMPELRLTKLLVLVGSALILIGALLPLNREIDTFTSNFDHVAIPQVSGLDTDEGAAVLTLGLITAGVSIAWSTGLRNSRELLVALIVLALVLAALLIDTSREIVRSLDSLDIEYSSTDILGPGIWMAGSGNALVLLGAALGLRPLTSRTRR